MPESAIYCDLSRQNLICPLPDEKARGHELFRIESIYVTFGP